MKRFLIMSIALVSLIAMASPVVADGAHSLVAPGNSGAARNVLGFYGDPNCLGDFASFLRGDISSDAGPDVTDTISDTFLLGIIVRSFGDPDLDCSDFAP